MAGPRGDRFVRREQRELRVDTSYCNTNHYDRNTLNLSPCFLASTLNLSPYHPACSRKARGARQGGKVTGLASLSPLREHRITY